MKTLYLSGPMSGVPFYNEGLFDVAELYAMSLGWAVINPAREDREAGIWMDPHGTPLSTEEYKEVIRTDLEKLGGCDAIWMLPHWRDSTGANIEYDFAVMHFLEIYEFGLDALPKVINA